MAKTSASPARRLQHQAQVRWSAARLFLRDIGPLAKNVHWARRLQARMSRKPKEHDNFHASA
jgi:hypothetical protein